MRKKNTTPIGLDLKLFWKGGRMLIAICIGMIVFSIETRWSLRLEIVKEGTKERTLGRPKIG